MDGLPPLPVLNNSPTPELTPQQEEIGNIRASWKVARQDPRLKQSMLDLINEPTKGLQLHPINPFAEPGKWLHRTWENMWEPIPEMWNSDKWYGKPLAVLSAPFRLLDAPMAGLATAAGFEHAGSAFEAGSQYAEDPTVSTPVAAGAEVLGIALDQLNPAYYMSMGASPLRKAAERVLKEPIGSAGLVDAKAIEDAARVSRHGADMSEETVRNVVAPALMAKSYYNAINPSEAAAKDLMDPHLVEHVWGAKKATKALNNGTTSYEDLVNAYRKNNSIKDLEPQHANFPRDLVMNDAAPLEAKLKAMAGHQAYNEKSIIEGRARTRIAGVDPLNPFEKYRSQVGGLTTPSLTKTVSQLTSRALGVWRDSKVLNTPLNKLLAPPQLKTVVDFFNARGMRMLDENATPWHLFNQLERIQAAVPEGRSAIQAGEHSGAFTSEGSLRKWMENELRGVPQAYRLQHLQGAREVYAAVLDILKKEPRAISAINPAKMDQGLKTLDNWLTQLGPNVHGAPGKFHTMMVDPTEDFTREFALSQRENKVRSLLTDIRDLANEQHQGLLPIVGGTPQQQMQGLAKATLTAQGGVVTAAGRAANIPVMLGQLMDEYNRLLNMRTAYPYAAQWRQMKMDSRNLLREIHDTLINSQDFIKSAMKHNGNPMDGTLLLGEMLSKNRPKFWENMAPRANKPFDAQHAMKIVAKIGARADKHVADGLMSAQTAQHIKQYLMSLNPSVDQTGLQQLVYAMSDLARAKAKSSIQAALFDHLTSRLNPHLDKIHANLITDHDREFRDIMGDLDRFQAYYDPRQGFHWLMKTGGPIDKLNKITGSAFVKAGFSPLLPDVLRSMVQQNAHIPVDAKNYGLGTVSKDAVLKELKAIDPVKFSRVSRVTEDELNTAIGDILPFQHTEDRVNRQLGPMQAAAQAGGANVHPRITKSMDRLQKERAIAKERIDGGMQKLVKITGSQQKADLLLQRVRTNLRKIMDDEYREDLKRGMGAVYREHYFPHYLVGKEADKDTFKTIKSGVSASGGLRDSEHAQISRKFHAMEKRVFPDASSVQHFINEINENPALYHLDHPLDVKIGSNISAAFALRKAAQLKARINREALSRINAVIPNGMGVLYLNNPETQMVSKGAKQVLEGQRWRSLEPLIPSMSNHYVPDVLYTYIEHFVPEYKRSEYVWNFFHKFNDFMARLMVRYNLAHVKNIASLSAIAGVDLKHVNQLLTEAYKNSGKYSKDFGLLERMAKALDDHPMYQESVRNGITHFDPDTFGKSVDQIIEGSMKPRSSQTMAYLKGTGQSVVQTITFGVLDKAVKTSLYKQMLEKGLPPSMAADWVNHFLIDYSARNLAPNLKRMGHAVMPYFGWRIGNALLHIPNALENPGKYLLVNHIRNYLSDSLMHTNPHDREHMPDALAEAIFLPWSMSQNGQQRVDFLDLPQDPYFRLVKQTVLEHPNNPMQWNAALARFLISHSRLGTWAYQAMVNKKRLDKETFFDTMFGTGDRSGYLKEVGWGLVPMGRLGRDLAESMWDPSVWSNIGPDLLGLLTRVNNVDYRGRVK